MADEIAYQQAAQVRQLLAERETAVAYEQTTRVDAVDKQLAGLGWKPEKAAKAVAADEPPQERHAEQRETTDTVAPRRGPGRPRKSE